MKLKITLNNLLEMFEEFQFQTGIPYQVNGLETTFRLPQQFGTSLLRHWHLRDGLELYIQTYQLTETIVMESNNQHSMFGLCYCISGAIEMMVNQSQSDLKIRPGACLSIQMTEAQSTVEIPAHQQICLVEIAISPSLIHTFIIEELDSFPPEFRRYLKDFDSFYWQQSATTGETIATLYQILNCPYQGATQRLYQGKRIRFLTIATS